MEHGAEKNNKKVSRVGTPYTRVWYKRRQLRDAILCSV